MGRDEGRPPTPVNGLASASDEELATAMAAGGDDRAPWNEFYRRYGDRLMRFIRYHALSFFREEDCEDVFSDTVIRVQAAIRRFHPRRDGALLSWSCTIARNVIVDKFREAEGEPHEFVNLDDVDETLVVEPADLPVTPTAQVADLALERVFARLPEHYKALLEFSRAGLSTDDIARRLGMAHHMVSKVRYKAVARLKELLIQEQKSRK